MGSTIEISSTENWDVMSDVQGGKTFSALLENPLIKTSVVRHLSSFSFLKQCQKRD